MSSRLLLLLTVALAGSAVACGEARRPTGPIEPVKPGPPASIVVLSGDRQIGVVNQVLPQPVRIQVKDAAGLGVPNRQVVLTDVVLSDSVSDPAYTNLTKTDSLGVATFDQFRVRQRAGTYHFSATDGLHTVTFDETLIATAPKTIGASLSLNDAHFLVGPGYTGEMVIPFALAVRDSFGNAASGANVSVSDRNGGHVSDSLLTTDSSGATPTVHWTLRSTLGPDTLQATAGPVVMRWSKPVHSGPAAFINVGSSANVDLPIGGTINGISVSVTDANGLAVTDAPVAWADGSTGAVLCMSFSAGGTATFDASSGCVWKPGPGPGTYSLRVSSGAATGTITARIIPKPGSLRTLVDPASNAYFAKGTSPADDVVVQLVAPDGSPAPGYSVVFETFAPRTQFPSFSVTKGWATTTDAQGIARFKWTLPPYPTQYLLGIHVGLYPDVRTSIGAVVYGSPHLGYIAAGDAHTCGMPPYGDQLSPRMLCWGRNAERELADGTSIQRLIPVASAFDTIGEGFGSITARGGTTCAEFDDIFNAPPTHLYCWGANESGQAGTTNTPVWPPNDVMPHGGLGRPALGTTHGCGISMGQYWNYGYPYTYFTGIECWGDNRFGQLGDGTTNPRLTPAPIATSLNANNLSIGAGDGFTCALDGDGRALCWGRNSDGQLGDGTTNGHPIPTPVEGDIRFQPGTLQFDQAGQSKFAVGLTYVCAIGEDAITYCWGRNDAGQLGDGTTTSRARPTPVQTPARFVSLAAGNAHTCGITATGSAYCWGLNDHGQLGIGSTGPAVLVPTLVNSPVPFSIIAAGAHHTCAIARDDQAPYCWGLNSEGQLGDGTTIDRLTPTRVADYRPPPLSSSATSTHRVKPHCIPCSSQHP